MKLVSAEDLSIYVSLRMHNPVKVITPDRKVKSVVSSHKDENGKIMFTTNDGQVYSYENLIYYRPEFDGAVTAVNIVLKNGYQPFATITFAFGGYFTFEWDRCDIRDIFMPGINAYTIFYDERTKLTFDTYMKPIQDGIYPILTLENAMVGQKYAFCGGWVELTDIEHLTEDQANEESVLYLDRWIGIDWKGNLQGAAFTDGRKLDSDKNWKIYRTCHREEG